MRIAYFVNQYPAVSHAFIRREIHALERLGIEVVRYALKGWDAHIVDPLDEQERAQTTYIQREGIIGLVKAVLRLLVASPAAVLRGLFASVRLSVGSERPLPVHLAYFAEACRLHLLLGATNVEHVHAHFGTNSAEIVMLNRIMGGVPYSFTVHGPLEFDDPKGLKLADKIRNAKFVVAITSFTRSQLMRIPDRRDWGKIALVRCGLQPEIFAETAVPANAAKRLVVVGRLVEQKGHLLLIEAARAVKARGHDFKLLVLGDGPLRGELMDAVERYSLGDQIEFTGSVSTDRLYDEIRNARALVLPSFAEGLPMAIMEAMALHRPVITTFIAGIPELVISGDNGWLVPAGSIDELADAMQEALETPLEQLNEMGERAFARVRRLHSADQNALELAQLIAPPARTRASHAI
jgi:glycosyltransferase involved in cell wall biosynthesis